VTDFFDMENCNLNLIFSCSLCHLQYNLIEEETESEVQFARLFAKLPWPADSKGIFSVLSHAATCSYLFNHSKVEASHYLPCPSTHQANLSACSPHYSFKAETRNLWIQTSKSFSLTQKNINMK